MHPETLKNDVYTVSQITKEIRLSLETSFPFVWVEGEVSNVRKPASGHIYFTLKDAASQLACVLFRPLSKRVKFELKDGIKVVVSGKISVYERSGAYQLYVEGIEPRGVGALQLAFEQLKKKLFAEGMFSPERKQPIPLLPQRIGVVTSPTGAAIRDIVNVIGRRFSNVHIIVNPVRVQGDSAAGEIARAIDVFDRLDMVDVIIVGRGGGSLEDLWAFNEEIVARAIDACHIPVISAVGHEIDWTIADFVADLRAPTPSAAAELVIGSKEEFLSRINYCLKRLHAFPLHALRQSEQKADDLARSLHGAMSYIVESRHRELQALAGRLEALSPLGILARGYTITHDKKSGQVIKDAAQVKPGQRIETKLFRGRITSRVEGDIRVKTDLFGDI